MFFHAYHVLAWWDHTWNEDLHFIWRKWCIVYGFLCLCATMAEMSAVPATETMQLTNTEIIFTSKSHRERNINISYHPPKSLKIYFKINLFVGKWYPLVAFWRKKHLLLSTRTANSTRTPTVIQGHWIVNCRHWSHWWCSLLSPGPSLMNLTFFLN